MKAKFLGALKAAAPTLLSLAYVAVDAVFGTQVDLTQVHALVIGLVTSVVVWFVPNLHSVDTPPAKDAVSKP